MWSKCNVVKMHWLTSLVVASVSPPVRVTIQHSASKLEFNCFGKNIHDVTPSYFVLCFLYIMYCILYFVFCLLYIVFCFLYIVFCIFDELPEKDQFWRDSFVFCQELQLSPFQLEEIGSNFCT